MQRQINEQGLKRLKDLRKLERALSLMSGESICFPEGSVAYVGFSIQQGTAFDAKRTLVGDRFKSHIQKAHALRVGPWPVSRVIISVCSGYLRT